MDYARQDANYWTPNNHRAIAATFSASFPVSERVTLNSSTSINRNKDNENEKAGIDYYTSIGSTVKLGAGRELSVSAHDIKSQQKDSAWNEKGADVGVTFGHH